jgi:hypothetical protein
MVWRLLYNSVGNLFDLPVLPVHAFSRLPFFAMSSPNTNLSGYSSPWTSNGSDCEQQRSSLFWMLKALGVALDHELDPPPAIVPYDYVAQKLRSLSVATQQTGHESSPKLDLSSSGVVIESFLRGQSQWIDEPVISKWRELGPELLSTLETVSQLYYEWRQIEPAPFDPFFDRLWLESAVTLWEAGLPWHNNNLNMPDEVDTR